MVGWLSNSILPCTAARNMIVPYCGPVLLWFLMIRLWSEAGWCGFVAVSVCQQPYHGQRLLLRQSDALAHTVMGAVPVADVDLGGPAVPGYEVDLFGPRLILDLIPVEDADVIHDLKADLVRCLGRIGPKRRGAGGVWYNMADRSERAGSCPGQVVLPNRKVCRRWQRNRETTFLTICAPRRRPLPSGRRGRWTAWC